MPADDIDTLLDLWASKDLKHDDCPPFADHDDMYGTIDAIPHGDVAWECFSASYQGEKPEDAPAWMDATFEVWFRDPQTVVNNMLGNPDFRDQFDYSPFREYDGADMRQFENFMSGDWAWQQAVCCLAASEQALIYLKDKIAEDPKTHGSMFVPIILGSDKTTVSVATGHNEYYPLYASIGNVHNSVRRAHRNAVALVGFLAIPKSNSFLSYCIEP
jgi:hypothetical protein